MAEFQALSGPRSDGTNKARDILERQDEMERERALYEPTWELVAQFCAPDSPALQWKGRSGVRDNQVSRAAERMPQVYDNTIISAKTRLQAGLESLIIPQSEKWHGLTTAALDDEETDEEKKWAEGLRDFLFSIRYSARSNFVPATQSILDNVVTFGPGYLYAEPGFGGQLVYYCSIPVAEGFIARNKWGEVDIFHRRYSQPARVLAQTVGYDNLPRSIQEMANDPVKCLELVQVIQSVYPRPEEERELYMRGRRDEDGSYSTEPEYLKGAFASCHVVEQEEAVVMEKSFDSFPVSCFSWRRHEGDTYGISPTIMALTTVRELNDVRKVALRALQQATDPATASAVTLDYFPILNPGQNYAGLLDEQGRPLIAPINTGANPNVAFEYAQLRAEDIRDMMFVNLFQTLVQNPEMTATEALIRQEEKGALLGPSGSVIQAGFASNFDRELTILEKKGLYQEGSRFVPPASLAGKDVRPTFTSPLDVLRRSAEARDAIQVVGAAIQLATATADPSVMDTIDGDEYLKIVKDAGRSPQRLFRDQAQVDALRDARAKAQEAAAGMAALAGAAKAAKDGVPAAVQARDAGLLPRPQ